VSVQPYTSPEAPAPNTNDGNSSGPPIPANAPVPDLAMAWTPTTAPPFISAGTGGGSGSSSSDVTPSPDFSIDLEGLGDAQNQMLNASSTVVNAYEALKQQFESVQSTVFGQQAQTTTQSSSDSSSGYDSWNTTTSPDSIQQAAQTFANGQNGQPGMNDIQAYALEQIGNAMAAVGQFIVLMNTAGISYATADTNSALPPSS
jgi:hypothetical protein